MRRKSISTLLLAALLAPALFSQAGPPPSTDAPLGLDGEAQQDEPETAPAAGVAWFGRWDDAKAEAARTGRPILLMSAAPQCSGAPGMW
ncbi:MAG: hypothetical protein P1V81_12765 [Planctomycetota bacterium]|nr:hypothetical protein [Planctomycetota bacterium]